MSLRKKSLLNTWNAARLEQRVMLDADAPAETGTAQAEVSPLTANHHAPAAGVGQAREIVFVDSSVEEFDSLLAQVMNGAEVVLLDANESPLQQITTVLGTKKDLSAIHVVTHGTDGLLHFAGADVDLATIESNEAQLASWRSALTSNADILLYGCNVAEGPTGQQFVQRLSELTGADVAASTNESGSPRVGADWVLETEIGVIETSLVLSPVAIQTYEHTLIVVDFESQSNGSQGSTFTESGFRFADGGFGSQDLLVLGNESGYSSQAIHSQNFARSITVDRADGQAFSLASFDYAAGRWNRYNNAIADATVTGTLLDGSTVTSSLTATTQSFETLDLNWTNLSQVEIDFAGGASSSYGAVDNFDFGAGNSNQSVISFDTGSLSLTESSGSTTITVNRSGNLDSAISVDYASSDGTAIQNQDYQATTGTLSFAAGQSSATISVSVLDDTDVESNETFAIELSSSSPDTAFGLGILQITITDDDFSDGDVQTIDFEDLSTGLQGATLTTDGYTFSDVGWGANEVQIFDESAGYVGNVLHSQNWNRGIELARADGQSFNLASFDYGAGRWNTLTDATVTATFADGSTDSQTLSTSTKNLNTLTLNWSNLSSVLIDYRGGLSNAYGALDNFVLGDGGVVDPPPIPGTIGLTVDSITIDETASAVNVIVFRGDGSDGVVTVDYTTNNGSATAGEDFSSISGTLTFQDGETGQQLSIPILDDNLPEAAESFSLTISNPTGGATLAGLTTQTINISENDQVTTGILFEDSFEGSIAWTTDPNGTDTATTGTWEAGAPSQTESGTTTLQLASGHTGSRAMITGLAAGTSVGTYDIDGGVTSVRSPVVDLPNADELELRFEYYLAYLDNASNDDFFSASIVSNGTVTEVYDDHAHNEAQSANWQFVSVDISQYAGESIQILFQAADALGGSLVEAGVDDVVVESLPIAPGEINVATTSVNLNESAGTAEIVLTRSIGRLGEISVDYTTTPGTADSNDFTSSSGTLTFADGQAEATIQIPITDDSAEESLESFTVTISNAGGGAVLGDDTVATVTIVDNDNTGTDFLPDLTPIAETSNNHYIDTTEQPGRRLLRFSTEVANAGDGPLEIWGGTASGSSQQVFQRIYQENGGSRDVLAGEFVYHPGHGHIHFEAFATYDLQLIDANGTVIASGGKTSFCLINIRQPLPDVTANADLVHGRGGESCGNVQGISAGYSDVYGASLDDQWIDVTDVANGTYELRITADPDDNIAETDETNNSSSIMVTISGTSTS